MSKTISPEDKKLNEQIKKLKLESKLNKEIKIKIPNTKYNLCGVGGKPEDIFIHCEAKDKFEFQDILKVYPPINNQIKFGSSKEETVLETQFKLTLDNPARPNQWNDFDLDIKYHAKEFEVWITLPIQEILQFVNTTTRNVTDSEYGYFEGYSFNELRDMKVRMYQWNNRKVVRWYGGNETLKCINTISEVINSLKS